MRGQNILRELNDLARAIGAPVDGTNISEQVAKLKGHMASDTIPYSKVTDKPKINNVTVDGNLSWEDLGLANPMHIAGSVATVADLANIENPQPGDVYLVGPSDGIKDEYCYTEAGDWEFIGDRVVVVDDALNESSENPPQNKVVAIPLNAVTTKTQGIDSTDTNYIEMENGVRLYISSTAPTGTIPDGSIGVGW